MYLRIFRQKGSRVYRVRYRLSNGPRIYDAPLHSAIKEVAEAKARRLIEEQEKELAGILGPKALRVAALRPLASHCADFVADLAMRERGKAHRVHVKCRLERLIKECHWQQFRDVTVESFTNWQSRQKDLSAKTLNEYLGHASALLNWMVRQGRATHNPLKAVQKLNTRGRETFKRRALETGEFVRLVSAGGKRSLAYLFAGCTGLRRGEIRQVLWNDIHLEVERPHIAVRAEITKSKRAAVIPLLPVLFEALKRSKPALPGHTGKVFPRGLPSVKTLHKDLVACGIPVEDERGYRLDFHALRHTFASLLAEAQVSELARVKLARHSEWRQTDRYTDPQSIPLFSEMAKLAAILPSSIASPNSGKTCENLDKVVQTEPADFAAQTPDFRGESALLHKAVPTWESLEMVPKGGLEPPCC